MATARAKVGFWLYARESDTRQAWLNRRTWLAGERHVFICVVKGTPAAKEPGVRAFSIGDFPIPPSIRESAAGRRSHEIPRLNGFLRAKTKAILNAICRSGEDFSVVLDDDTGINATNLRRYLAVHSDPSRPLFLTTAHFGHGGGPGMVFSRRAAQQMCNKECSLRLGEAGSIDRFLLACQKESGLSLTTTKLMSVWPAWAVENGMKDQLESFISFHRSKPHANDLGYSADPRCRILSTYPIGRHGAAAPQLQQQRCAPHFALIGTPEGGSAPLYEALLQHPQMVAPSPKALHVYTPFVDMRRGRNLTLAEYSKLFPPVDPRDFRVTGEATAQQMYHPAAPAFLLREVRLRCLLVLRHPIERALVEFGKRAARLPHQRSNVDGYVKPWIGDARSWADLVERTVLPPALSGRLDVSVECGQPEPPDWRRLRHELLPPSCDLRRASVGSCISPIIYQSWYSLFLPPWLQGGRNRTRVIFADDLASDPRRALDNVLDFLQLQPKSLSAEVNFEITKPMCESKRSLAQGQTLMAPSLRSLRPLLACHGYRMPEAWERPPQTCQNGRASVVSNGG